MIKVNYDTTTGEIKGFYPDDIGYVSIPEPHIEIDETAHQDCMNHQGLRKVDLETKKIISFEPVIQEQTPVEHEQVNPIVLDMAEAIVALQKEIEDLKGGSK